MYRRLVDFIVTPLREAENQRREFLLTEEGRRVDWEVIAVLSTTALMLTLQHYAFADGGGREWLLDTKSAGGELARGVNWTILQIVAYAVAPFLVIRLFRGRSIRDYGIGFRGVLPLWWVYVLMYLVTLPCVLCVSFDASFQRTYPLYRLQAGEPLWPRFVVWQILYGVQFLALEFFFRGFLVHGMKRRFGAYTILVMTVPYCMIHFDKPLPETLGSIAAGLALGFMSLKTKSIWPGAAVHIAVAWTMDAAALYQQMR
jgi:membrane protease YdiL (CAAX protease family)